jgi:hypothetical protein
VTYSTTFQGGAAEVTAAFDDAKASVERNYEGSPARGQLLEDMGKLSDFAAARAEKHGTVSGSASGWASVQSDGTINYGHSIGITVAPATAADPSP